MKSGLAVLVAGILAAGACTSGVSSFTLDGFEGELTALTVDYGSGNGSTVNVSSSQDIKHEGSQSIKVEYNTVSGGYMWVARGYGLDVKGAAEWTASPEAIDWSEWGGLSFYVNGEGDGTMIAFDVKDAGGELWRTVFTIDEPGWQQVQVPFEHLFARTDWQPDSARVDDVLDFPLQSYQLEVRTPGEGVFYVDSVELTR
jgi:hypothetical protein